MLVSLSVVCFCHISINSSWKAHSAPAFFLLPFFFCLLPIPSVAADFLHENISTRMDLQAGWERWIQQPVLLSASSSQAKWNLIQPWECSVEKAWFFILWRDLHAAFLRQPSSVTFKTTWIVGRLVVIFIDVISEASGHNLDRAVLQTTNLRSTSKHLPSVS